MIKILNKWPLNNSFKIFNQHESLRLSSMNLSIVPSLYDGERDPGPQFFSSNVQLLLKRLTRPDLSKVFRKRTDKERSVLKTPIYKFLTSEELTTEIARAKRKANKLLQMPPVIKVHENVNETISRDPALLGYDSSTFLFTDITFGVSNENRIIVERSPDGTLRSCEHDIKKRLNQVYFPIHGRKIREPLMFSDEERLNSLLDNEYYEFVLDRACIQYEPDEPSYQKITSITYQHVDNTKKYDKLRSTRHFGPLVFYLTWHQNMDNMMLDLLQNSFIREGVLLVALRQFIHGDVVNGDAAQNLVESILATPIQFVKPLNLSQEDVELDNKCVDCVENYIFNNSSMKSHQELALQGFREYYHQLIEISEGVRKAHGSS